MKLITKRDFIIILSILILAAAATIVPSFIKGGEYAEISFDGEIVETVSLDENRTFTINGITFDIRDGKIAVTDSPCRDGICIHTGYVSSPSQTIVCLPKKMSVRIIGEKSGADIVVG